MTLGPWFLNVHVALSLIALVSGLAAAYAMLRGRTAATITFVFLATTILTSVTGFPLPPGGLDPPRVVGSLSLVLLALACAGLYVFRQRGAWRSIYLGTALAALYLNCFVAVVQAFQKIPAVNALAPTQSEPPFVIAQVLVLLAFVALATVTIRRKPPLSAR